MGLGKKVVESIDFAYHADYLRRGFGCIGNESESSVEWLSGAEERTVHGYFYRCAFAGLDFRGFGAYFHCRIGGEEPTDQQLTLAGVGNGKCAGLLSLTGGKAVKVDCFGAEGGYGSFVQLFGGEV